MNEDKQNKQSNENEEKDPFTDEEEFKKMLDSLIESETGQKGNTRVLIFSNRLFKNIIFDFFFILILNMFLFVGTDGLFQIYQYETMWHFLIYVGAFSVCEYLLKTIMYKFGLPLVLKSLGTINLLITVLSVGGCLYGSYLLFNIGLESFAKFAITLVAILIIRSTLCSNIRMKLMKRGK